MDHVLHTLQTSHLSGADGGARELSSVISSSVPKNSSQHLEYLEDLSYRLVSSSEVEPSSDNSTFSDLPQDEARPFTWKSGVTRYQSYLRSQKPT